MVNIHDETPRGTLCVNDESFPRECVAPLCHGRITPPDVSTGDRAMDVEGSEYRFFPIDRIEAYEMVVFEV